MSWLSVLTSQEFRDIGKSLSKSALQRQKALLIRHRIRFAPAPGTIDAYVQTRTVARAGMNPGKKVLEPCYFRQTGLARCDGFAVMPRELRLVSFPAAGRRLGFEELPICVRCRLDVKDRCRANMRLWFGEDDMWTDLLPAAWFGPGRDSDGNPKLLKDQRSFMAALGSGFVLRTMLVNPVPMPCMTVPPESYHVRKRRMPSKPSTFRTESVLDIYMKRLED